MSLARTALRLATVEAIKANSAVATLCEGRIYDSRISELDAKEPVPVIVVLTEDASGKAFSANNGGLPFDDRCELVIEISLRIVVPAENGDPDIMLVETDRDAEARLDLLEHSAIEAITVADTAQSRLVRQKVTRRVTDYKSVRFTSDETGLKLAVRLVSLSVELKGDDERDATVTPTGPYASLPEPLRSVALAMPAGSSGKATCDQIEALLSEEEAEPFLGADLVLAQHQLVSGSSPSKAEDVGAERTFAQDVTIADWSAP